MWEIISVRMKILFAGDSSNYHRTLAGALRELGHEVTVASDGSRWMNTERDIDLSRPLPGKLGGLALNIKLKALSSKFRGYDVVHINNPVFVNLRPHRVKRIFDCLKRDNRAVFLSAMGTDTAYMEEANSPMRLRYSEWQVGGVPTPHALQHADIRNDWFSAPLCTHCEDIYGQVDGVVSALYEYHLAFQSRFDCTHLAYGGIPVDTRRLELIHGDAVPRKVRIFIGLQRNRLTEKGTDRMLAAAKRVVERHPDKAELVVVENRPYAEYIELMKSSHVLLDQLYSYTPATNALIAMSYGIIAVSGGEDDYYDFIGEEDNHPIVNALPDDDVLTSQIEEIVFHPERLPEMARCSREFVVKHNDSHVVARRFLEFWNKRFENL